MRTPEGNVMDYDVICADIRELGERYDTRVIAVDRWNVNQITPLLCFAIAGVNVILLGPIPSFG